MSVKLSYLAYLLKFLLGVILLTACQSGPATPLPSLLPTRTAAPPGVVISATAVSTVIPKPIATARPLSTKAITSNNAAQVRALATRDEASPIRILALNNNRLLGQTSRGIELIDRETLTHSARITFELNSENAQQLFWYTVSADTNWAATLEIDGTLIIYDLNKQLVSKRLKLDAPTETNKVDIALSPDGKQLIYANAEVKRLDLATGKTQGRAQTLPESTESILFSADGAQLAAVQPSGSVSIFDTRAARRATTPLTIKTGFTEVRTLQFSPSGTHIGISNGQSGLEVWTLADGKRDTPLRRFDLSQPVLPVFDEAVQRIALVSNVDVNIYNVESGKQEQTLKLDEGINPTGATFDPSGETIYVNSINSITQFRVTDGEMIKTSSRPPVTHIAFAPDGKRLVSWGTWNPSTEIAIWETGDLQPVARLPHTTAVRWVVVGPAQKYLASITVDNTIHVWDVNAGSEALSLPPPSSDVQRALLCLSNNDANIIFIEQGKVVVQPIAQGKPRSVTLPEGSRGYTTCQNSQSQLAVVTADAIVVLDLNGKTIATIKLPQDAPELRNNLQMILSDDATRVAAVSETKLYVWEVKTGALLSQATIQRQALFGIVFGPDGKRIAVNYGDEADIVEVETGKVTSLEIPTRPQARWVNLIFGADPNLVITASRVSNKDSASKALGEREYVDGEIAFWDARTGKLIHAIEKTGLLYSVVASADGTRIATGTQSEQLTVWEIK